MSTRVRWTLLLLLALPAAARAGDGWFSHHHCPKPSYNWWNYTFPKPAYEWRAYLHPVPADYRHGPFPPAGAAPGVRWFPCPPVDPATLYPPPPPSAAAPAASAPQTPPSNRPLSPGDRSELAR